MATITNPMLKIQTGLPGKKVKADVTCQVQFSPAEMEDMKHGVKYVATCHLMGDDPNLPNFLSKILSIPTPLGNISIPISLGGDKVEYTYGNTFVFPDRTPAATEALSFSAEMPSNTLNEDDLPFLSLEDEIYALITLKNVKTDKAIQRTSNTVTHRF